MKIKIISLFLIVAIFILIAAGIYMLHTYPGKVAAKRKHPQLKAIEVTSVTGLIFFPLWIFALIWAYSNVVIGTLYNTGDTTEEDLDDVKSLATETIDKEKTAETKNQKSTDNT